MVLLVAVAVLVLGIPAMQRWLGGDGEDAGQRPGATADTSVAGEEDQEQPTLRPEPPPNPVHAISIDFGIVTDPTTNWDDVASRLDQVGATTVDLGAGRVEFTAFDWAAHPEAAAEPGTDHLADAARRLSVAGDSSPRQVNLIVDAYVPEWISSDPSVAGVDAAGKTSSYAASAAQLYEGEVGDRLVAYVVALGERYDPNAIQITELFLDRYAFGDDDLALFVKMTGAEDWPRTKAGDIDTAAAAVGAWRSQVLAAFLTKMRTALDGVRDGAGSEIGLTADVRVNWDDPSAGRPLSGHDYPTLLGAVDQLQLWTYLGRSGSDGNNRPAGDIGELTGDLSDAGYDMSRFVISVGLWAGPPDAVPPGRITPAQLAAAAPAAQTNGIRAVNVTPYALMTPEHWTALAAVWAVPAATPSASPTSSPS